MHVTKTVEYRYSCRSERKLTYGEIEMRAKDADDAGELELLAVSDVRMFLEDAHPGDAVAH